MSQSPQKPALPTLPVDLARRNIQEFLKDIKPLRDAYKSDSFSYLAIRQDSEWILIQGAIHFNTNVIDQRFGHFRSANVRAGRFKLSEINLEGGAFLAKLLSGGVPTPEGELRFPPTDAGTYISSTTPFLPHGLQRQARINSVNVAGIQRHQFIRQPFLDWEVKAASVPYDGLLELQQEFLLDPVRSDLISVDAIAFDVAAIDGASVVDGTAARLSARLANGLDPAKFTLGYRMLSQGKVAVRDVIQGDAMTWTQEEGFQQGTTAIDVPAAAVLNCVASYDGIAQHYYWLGDPKNSQNPRRAAFECVDSGLEALSETIAKTGIKGTDSRVLETAVGSLFWLLGFSVAHLGRSPRLQDGADLIVTTPAGHFALIECTTGHVKAAHKVPLLHGRAKELRRRLDAASSQHLRVLPVIVTNKLAADVEPELEQANKSGVLVLAREALDDLIVRTLVMPDPDQLYDTAEKALEAGQQANGAQGSLDLG